MAVTASCSTILSGRRNQFWTNRLKPAAGLCNSYCEDVCMEMSFVNDQATFETDGFIQSMVLNVLLTDGTVTESECGTRVGNRGGHWTDSFREDTRYGTGSLFRAIPASGNIRDSIALIRAYANLALQKLVHYEVVQKISATTKYIGGSRAELTVEITNFANESQNILISGERTTTGWIWT